MKILQITSDYLPDPLWGMGWHVSQIYSLLSKSNKVSCYVATTSKSKDYHEDIITSNKDMDSKLLSDNSFEIFNNYEDFNKWQLHLADKIIEFGVHFDVVHVHNWMSWLTARKLLKEGYAKKSVITFHFLQKQYELMEDNPIPSFHKEIIEIEKDALENANNIVLLSQSQKVLVLERYLGKDSKISLIPHSINFKPWEYSDLEKAKHSEDKINITFVGRIENDKGIVEAIEAFKQLKYENIHFHVVGNGPMLCFLRKMYQGDKSITFYGYQDKKDVQNILSRTHIFCMPSVSENLPISVLEAMFMGAVPIFSRGDTVPKLFEDNIHGLTVPLNLFKDKLEPDVNSIISAYKELINNPNKLETLSKNVYKFAASAYSIEALRDKLLKLYSQ